MAGVTNSDDMRLGYAIVLGVAVVGGGLAMMVAPGDLLGAGGFALAIIAGLALIAALHLIE